MRLNKDVYVKTYEELQKKFLSLFWCIIHISYKEFKKLSEQEIMSLKIRQNEFVFEKDDNNE